MPSHIDVGVGLRSLADNLKLCFKYTYFVVWANRKQQLAEDRYMYDKFTGRLIGVLTSFGMST